MPFIIPRIPSVLAMWLRAGARLRRCVGECVSAWFCVLRVECCVCTSHIESSSSTPPPPTTTTITITTTVTITTVTITSTRTIDHALTQTCR
jgi:hypothetical protein